MLRAGSVVIVDEVINATTCAGSVVIVDEVINATCWFCCNCGRGNQCHALALL